MKIQWKVLLPAVSMAGICASHAFDLTPDRGPWVSSMSGGMDPGLSSNTTFKVFNVDPVGNYGPVNSYLLPWSMGQWRNNIGKLVGPTSMKPSYCQYDMTTITNGWFTPAPAGGSCGGGMTSNISSGWQDTYTVTQPTLGSSGLSLPAAHVRVDPGNNYTSDLNKVNNEAFVTMVWNGSMSKYYPAPNVTIPTTTISLIATDSLYYGAYSTTNVDGNVILQSLSSGSPQNFTLNAGGNSKIGFQGRRFKATLTGGGKSTFNIQGGSVVTVGLLGQNVY